MEKSLALILVILTIMFATLYTVWDDVQSAKIERREAWNQAMQERAEERQILLEIQTILKRMDAKEDWHQGR